MAQSTTMRLRGLWLQIHKWIGLSLAILIIPISVTGAALVWKDWLDGRINPQRFAVTASAARLGPGAYADAARRAARTAGRMISLRYPEDGAGPVVATLTQPQPGRLNVWIDPGDGHVLDAAGSNSGLVRVFHVLHESMLVPVWGRTIVGWVGIFMFVSCLTGIWLWWPITGSLRRGWRWKRQNSTNANIHHLLGFWILLPLAMLSFTGMWISFPGVFGSGGPPRGAPAQPLGQTRMTPDAALAAAGPLAEGGRIANIVWPTDKSSEWKISFDRAGGMNEIAVDDVTARAAARGPGGGQRPLMRRLHDGTGMGPVWQVVIFLGGLIPAILAVTGIVMWLRSRGWRAKLAKKRKARAELAPQPAE